MVGPGTIMEPSSKHEWLRKGPKNVICPECRYKFVRKGAECDPGECPKCHWQYLCIGNFLYGEPREEGEEDEYS
eukprot:g58312.t1